MSTIRNPKTLFLKLSSTVLGARQAIAKCKSHGVYDPGILGTLLIFHSCTAINIKRKQSFGIAGRQRELKTAERFLLVSLFFARLNKPHSHNHPVFQPPDHLGVPQLDLLHLVLILLVPREPRAAQAGGLNRGE